MKFLKVCIFVFLLMVTLAANAHYIEKSGLAVIEAEDFTSQHLDSHRRWIIFSQDSTQHNYADNDVAHLRNASQNSYIEVLPDTRTNHSELLVKNRNFTDIPGKIAVLTYPLYFNTPGTYYVWARAFSTGSEDNGIHVGLNGTWPDSGRRLQFCKSKNQWAWSSAQRTKENHCGIPNTITLTVPEAGVHMVTVSMREDGFELDKLLLTSDKNYTPSGIDSAPTKFKSKALQEKRSLLDITHYKKILHAHSDFSYNNQKDIHFYHHKAQQALAINAANQNFRNKYAYAEYIVTAKDEGKHQLTLVTLSEIDGESTYQVLLNGKLIGNFKNPKTSVDYKEAYFDIDNITLKQNDIIKVGSMAVTNGKIPENDGTAFARGRWRALVIGTQ